ncbi:MAG TPA: hypothetical protein VLJ19_19095 [Variovorax sp.]|nr:hypothetical protein [Variovorax sp.]
MSDSQMPTNWWQTLPGVLTALAGGVIAIGGLVTLLFQLGILGSKSDGVRSAATRHAPPPVAAPAPPVPPPSAFATPIPPPGKRTWPEAEAVVQTRDGTTTRLRADSFAACVSVAHNLTLDNGQSIPFERMAGFEVYHSDPHASPDAKARLLVEMRDGKKVQATVAAACELFGDNVEGRFSAYYEGIRSVRFER